MEAQSIIAAQTTVGGMEECLFSPSTLGDPGARFFNLNSALFCHLDDVACLEVSRRKLEYSSANENKGTTWLACLSLI